MGYSPQPTVPLASSPAVHRFAGYKWTRVQLGRVFCVLSADDPNDCAGDVDIGRNSLAEADALPRPKPTELMTDAECIPEPTTPAPWLSRETVPIDWTNRPLTDATSSHIRRLGLTDWAATPLGPIESWNWDLRAAYDMLIRTPYPAAMYWGPEFVVIYNEPYIDLAGCKHPELLGTPYAKAWPEIWHLIEPFLMAAWKNGHATMKHNDRLFIRRGEFLEEAFFSWSLVPLLGSTGRVAGIFNAAFETTLQVVSERRLQTLQEVGEYTATAKALHDFWALVLRGMANNEADFPFCLIYSSAEHPGHDDSSFQSDNSPASTLLSLEGSLGVPDGHPSAPDQLDVSGFEGFAPYMRQSVAIGGSPIILSNADGTLPAHLIDGLQWLGFGEPSWAVVVFAVTPVTPKYAPSNPPQSRGFVVLGVNPRRPYDSAYELFIQLLTRQLGTSLASLLLFEDQVKRSERDARLAALDRQRLSVQLHQRTQEAAESEYKFARVAE